MTSTEKVARLEGLLARVVERKNTPRPARPVAAAAAAAAVPASVSAVAAPPRAAAAPLPVAAKPSAPTAPAPVPPPVSAVVAPVRAPEAIVAPPATAAPLATVPSPSARVVEDEHAEFEIPSRTPTPSLSSYETDAPDSIELSPEVEDDELEIEHEPLASALPPRPERLDERELDLGGPVATMSPAHSVAAEVAASAIVGAVATAGLVRGVVAGVVNAGASAPAPEAPAPASQAKPPAVAPASTAADAEQTLTQWKVTPTKQQAVSAAPGVRPGPLPGAKPPELVGAEAASQRFEPSALPATELVRAVGASPAPVPATFRSLLQRSLALRVKA